MTNFLIVERVVDVDVRSLKSLRIFGEEALIIQHHESSLAYGYETYEFVGKIITPLGYLTIRPMSMVGEPDFEALSL